jgi:hypothetical protein
MNLPRFPLGEPLLKLRPGGHKNPFIVQRDFVYCWPGFGKWPAMDVCTSKDYETDLLSIPQPLWPILSPFGAGAYGAMPHDPLYGSEYSLPGQSKRDARAMHDRILYDAAVDGGASPARAWVLYRGVRLGGWVSWRSHNPQEVSDGLQMLLEATERWQGLDKSLVPG